MPAPITIRLITDSVSPLPQIPGLPGSPIDPQPRKRILGPGPPPPLPPGVILHKSRKRRSDEFYKHWDKFTQRKVAAVPSLDVDVEGRPAHSVTENEEGVKSR
jgi:hypothetical protein